jgi:hypothetical protein
MGGGNLEQIVIPYSPRELQFKIHEAVDSHRFTVVVAHRRFGKTVSAINHLIKAAIECNKPNPRFAYIAPTYAQSKRVAWDYLLEFTRPLGAVANISELRVDFWGRRISLYGSETLIACVVSTLMALSLTRSETKTLRSGTRS